MEYRRSRWGMGRNGLLGTKKSHDSSAGERKDEGEEECGHGTDWDSFINTGCRTSA